jgi:hypothetical protein
MTDKKEDSLLVKADAFLVLMLLFPPLICAIDGCATLFHQTVDWFKTGVWEPRDFWTGVHHWFLTDRPYFEWVMPNRWLQSMLDGPRWVWMLVWSVILFVAEIAVLIVGMTYVEKGWKHWRDRKVRETS